MAIETPATERVGQRICQPKPPRHISTPPELDHGQLEFRWLSKGAPTTFKVEVFDGKWRLSSISYPEPGGEELLPYKNEMLSLARFGPVTKIRISLQDGDDHLYIDNVRIRKRVDRKSTEETK